MTRRMLYLDCSSGVSGDMVVAALLDAGADRARLDRALASLPVDGFSYAVTRRRARSLDCCDFDVILDEAHDGHDHDMAYLYGDLDEGASPTSAEGAGAGHGGGDHEREGGHAHAHACHHGHRHLADVLAIIDAAEMTPHAREIARRVFQIVADAEAKAHGVPAQEVHFHEVGAVDSIVDVVAAAVCLDDLDVEHVATTPLYEGQGSVRSQHGVLPVPVPAVANIVAAHGIPLTAGTRQGEFVTPTGAAIVAAVRDRATLPAAYVIEKVGLGAGKRAYDPPSVVRALVVREDDAAAPADEDDWVWKLETDVDDCTAEAVAHATRHLMDAGAREVHTLPLTMKHGRPGVQIQVICDERLAPALEGILFSDTTTIGVRRARMRRTVLPRALDCVRTPYGQVGVKVVTLPDGTRRAYPENRDVEAACEASGAGYQEVWRAAIAAADRLTLTTRA